MPAGALGDLEKHCEENQDRARCQLYFDKYRDSMLANGNADLVKWYEAILNDSQEFAPQMKAILDIADKETMAQVYKDNGIQHDEDKMEDMKNYALKWVEQQMRLGEKPNRAKLEAELRHVAQTKHERDWARDYPLYTHKDQLYIRLMDEIKEHPRGLIVTGHILNDPVFQDTPPDEQPAKFWELFTTKSYELRTPRPDGPPKPGE